MESISNTKRVTVGVDGSGLPQPQVESASTNQIYTEVADTPQQLAQLLEMPEGSHPVAILCLGPVAAFYDQPMLQAEKWAHRAALADMVFEDRWGQSASPSEPTPHHLSSSHSES